MGRVREVACGTVLKTGTGLRGRPASGQTPAPPLPACARDMGGEACGLSPQAFGVQTPILHFDLGRTPDILLLRSCYGG